MRNELLTILFIRSSYKIRKFNLPFFYYQIVKVLCIVFIVAFFVILALGVHFKQDNEQLHAQIITLQQQLRELYLNSELKESKIEESGQSNFGPEQFVSAIDSHKVAVNELIVSKNPGGINVSFKLDNITNPHTLVNGRLVIAGFPLQTNHRSFTVFPQVVTFNQQNEIKNYKDGDPFSINYFKTISVNLQSMDEDVKQIVITAFSESGNIIYRQLKVINNGD